MEHLQRAVPVLFALNVKESVAFYRDKFGFDQQGWVDDQYAVIGRDRIELHITKCNDRMFPENTSCYIHVKDVNGLYGELKAAGVVHPNGPLEDKPWGLREFSALDGEGNLLRFGQYL